MRISDWSSDVCSSDLADRAARQGMLVSCCEAPRDLGNKISRFPFLAITDQASRPAGTLEFSKPRLRCRAMRSEEHTSELQSLMRISYAVFCLKKKKKHLSFSKYLFSRLTSLCTVLYYM